MTILLHILAGLLTLLFFIALATVGIKVDKYLNPKEDFKLKPFDPTCAACQDECVDCNVHVYKN